MKKTIVCIGTQITNAGFDYDVREKLLRSEYDASSFYIFGRSQFDRETIKQLELVEYRDYCLSDVFAKKIMVVYGNCHAIPIVEQLKQQKGFSERYFIWPVPGICVIKNPELFLHPVFTKFCRIFIHQAIRDENAYGVEWSSNSIISRLPPGCEIISIPNLHKMPKYLFPQADSSVAIRWGGTRFLTSILSSINILKTTRAILAL